MNRARKALAEQLVHKEQLARKEPREPKGRKVLRVPGEQLAHRELQELKARKVLRDRRVLRAHKVLKAPGEQLAHKELRDHKDLRDHRDPSGQVTQPELRLKPCASPPMEFIS